MARRTEPTATVTSGLCSRPELLVIADELGISRDEAAFLCVRFWLWVGECCLIDADGDATLPAVSLGVVDLAVDRPGFGEVLVSVRWLFCDAGNLVVPHYTKHNKPASYAAERAERLLNRARRAQPQTVEMSKPDVSETKTAAEVTAEVQNRYFSGTKTGFKSTAEVQIDPPVPVTGSYRTKNQEPVTGTGKALKSVTSETLRDPLAMLRAFCECCRGDPGLGLEDTPAGRMAWFAMAARCRKIGKNPGALFCRSVVSRWWDRLTAADDDAAAKDVRRLTAAGVDWERADESEIPASLPPPKSHQTAKADASDDGLARAIIVSGKRAKKPENQIRRELAAAGLNYQF